MKNSGKRIAVLALAGVMMAGSMAGCSGKVDGTKTVVKVNDEEIKLGTLNLMLRYQQAQTAQLYQMYFGASDNIWDNVMDEDSGETYGEQTVKEVMEQVENMVLLRQHADDYKVSISDEEQEKITAAAESFLAANDENTLGKLGVDQSQVEEMLKLYYYNTKMHDPIVADADTKVSDEEAAQTGITYVMVSDSSDSDSDSDSDSESEESSEDTSADTKAKAQQILDEALATADADLDAIAKSVDENFSATEASFTTNPPEKKDGEDEDEDTASSETVPDEVQEAARKLSEGEVASELVEADGAYYIVRLDSTYDKEATEEKKTSIQEEKKEAFYDDTLEKWRKDSEITEQKSVLKGLKLRDNDKYTFKPVETPEPEESEDTAAEGTDDAAAGDAAEGTEDTSAGDTASETEDTASETETTDGAAEE